MYIDYIHHVIQVHLVFDSYFLSAESHQGSSTFYLEYKFAIKLSKSHLCTNKTNIPIPLPTLMYIIIDRNQYILLIFRSKI